MNPDPRTNRLRASAQAVARPRPQMLRESFLDLSGEWGFAHDDASAGTADGWFDGRPLDRVITVPFPPESPASGIGDTGRHDVVWYRREIDDAELAALGRAEGDRVLVHFGAVDHRARVWLNGTMIGGHEGGHTPFSLDATEALRSAEAGSPHVLVVRAEDDSSDVAQPRGKQDWREDPHSIWYHRTTGIWQPVWLEAVPPLHVARLRWTSDLAEGTATAHVTLSARAAATVRVCVSHDGRALGEATVSRDDDAFAVTVPLDGQDNGQGYEELLWRPGAPTLLDAWVEVDGGEAGRDVVASYLGLRSVATRDGRLLVNDRPVVLRSVLSQGYWPDTHLAAPSEGALRREAELILELGFNAVRVHQKIEDPRFLYHADRVGLLVWGEMPSSYAFSDTAVRRTVSEWTEAVIRDRSHPCIVTWVPLNESWGVQHISSRGDQRAYAEALYHLTKALDPTRPVVSNDGWEHMTSDLLTVHDYESSGAVLSARYGAIDRLGDIGPAGRPLRAGGSIPSDAPVMVTEFGGVKWAADDDVEGSWGYSEASGAADFERRIGEILSAVQGATQGHEGRDDGLAGWCWTQLTDTLQERNGLLTEDRRPKLPMERLRALVLGR